MAIGRPEIEHIARLARLGLTEPEIERLQADLGQILEYVGELANVDTSGAAELALPGAALRDDRVEPGVERETALEQAPRKAPLGFAVPGFMED